jgi:hypothetical protein
MSFTDAKLEIQILNFQEQRACEALDIFLELFIASFHDNQLLLRLWVSFDVNTNRDQPIYW